MVPVRWSDRPRSRLATQGSGDILRDEINLAKFFLGSEMWDHCLNFEISLFESAGGNRFLLGFG